uniref:glycosyltransferase family 2 protein n=1 Tax=Acetatifactor sp. TaxID=1872090 RepID=UPI0040572F09
MLQGLKRTIQNFMTMRYYKQYCADLKQQSNAYDAFMRKKEEQLQQSYANKNCDLTARVITKQEFVKKYAEWSRCSEDVLIVVHEDGVLNAVAENVILSYFSEHKECKLLYADEDVCFGSKLEFEQFRQKGVAFSRRCYPDFKPIPAPETFLSYQYFGNIWAVRSELCCERKEDGEEGITISDVEDVQVAEYDFLLKAWEKVGMEGIANIPEILYHKFVTGKTHTNGTFYTAEEMEQALRREDALCRGYEAKYNSIKEAWAKRQGRELLMKQEGIYSYPVYGILGELPKVSILIPSKDNPEVLRKCIASVYEKSSYQNFEIIVVDNGSNEQNRARIEVVRQTYPFLYIYQPMEFNYSAMNNIAASKATGSIVLLLNDDMEVVMTDWLERMVGQVLQPGIGAVGAKLLYPDTTLIQHVGITNAVDGPVHKLLKMDDTLSYNKGKNKLVYNVIGVTGACLMVKKEYLDRLNGLKETLRVAYNDVDFCFSLYEMGLRNVIRNDVVLYHHESLSRGADGMSAEKMERLKEERDYLYGCHPQFYCKDPYAGANNSGGAEFNIGILPDEEREMSGGVVEENAADYTIYPPGIHVVLDRAEKDVFAKGKRSVYVVQGYAVLPEADNCRYFFKMLFLGEDKTYSIPIRKRLRPNLSAGFPNAKNLELAGFCCYLTASDLPAGTYRIGIYAQDRCSRQKLFQDTGRVFTIE